MSIKAPKTKPFLLIVAIAILGLTTCVLLISTIFVSSHGVDQAAWCRNNIRQIDAAIVQWALEKHLPDGTSVTTNIGNYLTEGIPKCPIGGIYTLTKIGELPVCSKPTNAHKLVR